MRSWIFPQKSAAGTGPTEVEPNSSKDDVRENLNMKFLRFACIPGILLLAGCTQPQQSPQDVKERTAEATAAIKSDAKAVAEGGREGWNRNKPLDLNTATRDELMSLPGMSPAEADRVIAGRPYDDASDVVTRHILPKAEYDRISDRITAKR